MARGDHSTRAKDYAQWYLDIVRGADLADYAEVVRGCIVFKPTGYALWLMAPHRVFFRIGIYHPHGRTRLSAERCYALGLGWASLLWRMQEEDATPCEAR